MLQYLNSYGFMKSDYKVPSLKLLNEIGLIPLKYNGNMNNFDKILEKIKENYPQYINVIERDSLRKLPVIGLA